MSAASILFHESQWPGRLNRELISGLREGKLNPKFLYETHRQTARWLAVHQACSPSRTDPATQGIYEKAFAFAAAQQGGRKAHVIGLGCGGGKKDAALLRAFRPDAAPCYTALDAGAAMVLTASAEACSVIPENQCARVVCDLAAAPDLCDLIAKIESDRAGSYGNGTRIITFFGMIPNFRPREILALLGQLVRAGDLLLFSANLAPGENYSAGVRSVLPQYANRPVREWLLSFLDYAGIERDSGKLEFGIEELDGLERIVATFTFQRSCETEIEGEKIDFTAGFKLRLFFSARHTPGTVRSLLKNQGLKLLEEWISPSGEEGVFAAAR